MDDRLDLRCPFCAAAIVLYGEWDPIPNADEYTITSDDIIVCTCGATFGDGDTLDIIYA